MVTAWFAHAQKDSLFQKITDTLPLSTTQVIYKDKGKPISGIAGIYSTKLEGGKTANGEIFSNDSLTTASNHFKLNSWLRITNSRNHKQVIVRINDRMSASAVKKGVVIELSRAAAKTLVFNNKFSYKINIQQISITNLKSVDSIISDTNNIYKDSLIKSGNKAPVSFRKTGKLISGIASFYSSNLDGTKTSTGEVFKNSKATAASNNLKLNTWVLVTNLSNKKTVIVRINDRMHPRMMRKGRVVDLSRVAANELDFISKGLTRVRVETIEIIKSNPIEINDSLSIKIEDSIKLKDTAVSDLSNKKADTVKVKSAIGLAGVISEDMDGKKTATGEKFRSSKLSAACDVFSLNSRVRVTNVKNNKSVILRINDQLHHNKKKKAKLIDVSNAVAKKLALNKNGLSKVKVELAEKGILE